MTTTPAMTRDRIRTAERNAGVYSDDTHTHTETVTATTTIHIPGADETECNTMLTARHGLDALDLVDEFTQHRSLGTYQLLAYIELVDEPHTAEEIVDLLADTVPALGTRWTLTDTHGDTITTTIR